MIHLREDPMNMIICGVGGQGNILLSRMIGRILIRKDYRVDIGKVSGRPRGAARFSAVFGFPERRTTVP